MTIKEYITENNLTLVEFARLIGITKVTLWNYMNNKRKPCFKVMKKIMQATKNKINHNDFKE